MNELLQLSGPEMETILVAVVGVAGSGLVALAVVQTRVHHLEKRIEDKVSKDVVNAKLETLAVKIDTAIEGINSLHRRFDEHLQNCQ